MRIEIYDKGKLMDTVHVKIPVKGFSEKSYRLRKAIVDQAIVKIRKIYPYAELALIFESKMNKEESYVK